MISDYTICVTDDAPTSDALTTRSISTRLELDTGGQNPDNLISREKHITTASPVILPEHGMFFGLGTIVQVKDNLEPLLIGIDYRLGGLSKKHSLNPRSCVYTQIEMITNVDAELYITYQAFGGDNSYNVAELYRVYLAVMAERELRWWDTDIAGKPLMYPSAFHKHISHDFTGLDDLNNVILETAAIIDATDSNANNKMCILMDACKSKLDAVKIGLDNASIHVVNHNGFVRLAFPKSTNGDATFILDIELIEDNTSIRYLVAGEELDGAIVNPKFGWIGNEETNVRRCGLYTPDSLTNAFVLGTIGNKWRDATIVIRSAVINATPVDLFVDGDDVMSSNWRWHTQFTGIPNATEKPMPYGWSEHFHVADDITKGTFSVNNLPSATIAVGHVDYNSDDFQNKDEIILRDAGKQTDAPVRIEYPHDMTLVPSKGMVRVENDLSSAESQWSNGLDNIDTTVMSETDKCALIYEHSKDRTNFDGLDNSFIAQQSHLMCINDSDGNPVLGMYGELNGGRVICDGLLKEYVNVKYDLSTDPWIYLSGIIEWIKNRQACVYSDHDKILILGDSDSYYGEAVKSVDDNGLGIGLVSALSRENYIVTIKSVDDYYEIPTVITREELLTYSAIIYCCSDPSRTNMFAEPGLDNLEFFVNSGGGLYVTQSASQSPYNANEVLSLFNMELSSNADYPAVSSTLGDTYGEHYIWDNITTIPARRNTIAITGEEVPLNFHDLLLDINRENSSWAIPSAKCLSVTKIIAESKYTKFVAEVDKPGIVQLSNSYEGDSESLAVTELAARDGLDTKSDKTHKHDCSFVNSGVFKLVRLSKASLVQIGVTPLITAWNKNINVMGAITPKALKDMLEACTLKAHTHDCSKFVMGKLPLARYINAETAVYGWGRLDNDCTSNDGSSSPTSHALFYGLSLLSNTDHRHPASDIVSGVLSVDRLPATWSDNGKYGIIALAANMATPGLRNMGVSQSMAHNYVDYITGRVGTIKAIIEAADATQLNEAS